MLRHKSIALGSAPVRWPALASWRHPQNSGAKTAGELKLERRVNEVSSGNRGDTGHTQRQGYPSEPVSSHRAADPE